MSGSIRLDMSGHFIQNFAERLYATKLFQSLEWHSERPESIFLDFQNTSYGKARELFDLLKDMPGVIGATPIGWRETKYW